MPRPLSPTDKRLVAALIALQRGLPLVVTDLTIGDLDQEDRTALARSLRQIADDLDPIAVVEGTVVRIA